MSYEVEAALAGSELGERALPFAAYRDPDWYARELEHLFRGDWVAVCSAAMLREPGSYVALSIGGEPIAVVCDQAGRLHALSNACRHRGTQLLDEGTGEVKSIVCPYHAWAYDLDGGLRGAPMTGNIEFDAAAHGLPEFALEVWAGVVFVNVDGRALPLADRMKGAMQYLAPYGIERYDTPAGTRATENWDANWKLAFENGIESYHLFRVHKETFEPVAPTRGAYYVEGGPDWTITGGAMATHDGAYPGEPTSLDAEKRGQYVLVSLPPSFVGVLTRDSWGWITILPTSPASCSVTSEGLIPESLATYAASSSGPSADFIKTVLEEDRWICERNQRGIQARGSKGGQLVELERVVGDFQRYLASRMATRDPLSS